MALKKQFDCPACDERPRGVEAFEEHVRYHGFIDLADAWIKTQLGGIEPKCACGLCNMRPRWGGWGSGFVKFIRGHNGHIYSAYSPERATEITERRREALSKITGWSKGLTCETDERLAQAKRTRRATVERLQEENDGVAWKAWNNGLTKEIDARIKNAAETSKAAFASGERVSWQKGLTKETSPGLRMISEKIKAITNEKSMRDHLDSLKRISRDEIVRRIEKYATSLELLRGIDDYVTYKHRNLLFRCRRCGHEQLHSLVSSMTNRCVQCDPAGSGPQVAVGEFIRSLGFEVEHCRRDIISPYEIDVVVQGTDICYEYNGLYFHSELFKDKNHHMMKTLECSKLGKRLFHIFDDEWQKDQAIWQSMIRHRLGKTDRKFGARECSIERLTSRQKREFFDRCHIDGDANSSSAFGLVTKSGEIVSAISLRRPFHKRYDGLLEVARFASTLDTAVPGALGRLLKQAKQEVRDSSGTGLLSYVDLRHGDGKSYSTCGFEKIGTTSNRFWWTDGQTKFNRFKVKADKKRGVTEKEAADELGLIKLWGCANEIHVLRV